MDTACLLDVFDREIRCEYKGRVYKVRDNGAVCRVHKFGCPASKWDDVWTFGKPNDKTGYMEIAGERVHRIIAFAFLGNPPTEQHVVDHIDTNRRNNRPENLRWLTRLENALNNPITRKRIEIICGSVEAFLKDPTLLRGYERLDTNFNWMRTVTLDEAFISLERLTAWAKKPTESHGGSLGEWIYQEHQPLTIHDISKQTLPDPPIQYCPVSPYEPPEVEVYESPFHDEKTQSLTPNVVQINSNTPTEFPCCPQQFSGNPLEAYLANLAEGKVFCTNEYGDSTVLKYGIYQSELWVMCRTTMIFKDFAYTQIIFKDGIFYHRNKGVFDWGDEPYKMFEMIMDGEMG